MRANKITPHIPKSLRLVPGAAKIKKQVTLMFVFARQTSRSTTHVSSVIITIYRVVSPSNEGVGLIQADDAVESGGLGKIRARLDLQAVNDVGGRLRLGVGPSPCDPQSVLVQGMRGGTLKDSLQVSLLEPIVL